MQTGGARLDDVQLAEANELALYTLPLSASAIHMASVDSAPAGNKEQASTHLTPSTSVGKFNSNPLNCAQDSKGTEPKAAETVTQLAGASGLQNDTIRLAQVTTTPHQARDEVPNGAVNASSDQPATTNSAEPAPSTSAQPAQAATGIDSAAANASSSASASSRGGKAEEADKSKDAEKDRASVNTSTHTYARSQATRQKETKSASELAHTASTAAETPKKSKPSKKTKTKGNKAKASLFSRLFHVFVPCVGGSSKAHPVDIDIEKPRPTESAAPATTDLKEKQTAKEAEELPPKPSTSEVATPLEEVPKPSEQEEGRGTPVPPPLQPIDVPPPSDDPAVVVPPTPTKSVLPKDESGGVLSGSVQPIGSTGEEVAQEHRHRDSDHESDGSTSFTEDEEEVEEPNAIDEVEDEEERLIMNGGAGIPIGPVRVSLFPRRVTSPSANVAVR